RPDGDVASITDPLGHVTAFYTDAIGRNLLTIGALGNRTQQVHDPINGVHAVIDANSATATIAYTIVGKVASITDARGGNVAFTYDSRNLLASRADASNAVENVIQRDPVGNVLNGIDRKGQAVSFTYDPMNRPLTASYADGSIMTWTWDLGGRLTQVQDS